MSLKHGLIVVLGLALGLGATAAEAADGDAAALRQLHQARQLQALAAGKASATGANERIDRLLAEIARTQALAEHGAIRISRPHLQALETAAAQLGSERTFEVVASKGPPANGTIQGVVRDGSTLQAVGGVTVRAIDFSSSQTPSGTGIFGSVSSAPDGTFVLTVPPGKYTVRTLTSTAGASGYVGQAHAGLPCEDGFRCPQYFGTVVTVAPAATVAGIDFNLTAGGIVTGTVTRASDSTPLAGISVRALAENEVLGSGPTGSASTDANGVYTIRGLSSGRYRVFSQNDAVSGLMAEAYNDRPCAASYGPTGYQNPDCFYVAPDWVTVASGATASGADLALDGNPASIAGTITEQGTGTPLANAEVVLLSEDRLTYADALTDATGQYLFQQLRPGSYRVLARSPTYDPMTFAQLAQTHIPVVYPGVLCAGLNTPGCDPMSTGTPVVVGSGSAIAGIDFALARGGSLQGRVRRVDLLTPIEAVLINVYSDAIGYVYAYTDAAGNFTVGGLPPGVYAVYADAREAGYAATALGGSACNIFDTGLNACKSSGTRITIVGTETVTGVDIDAVRGGAISGAIRDATVDAPAPRNRTRLEVYDTSGNFVAIAIALFDGPSASTRYTLGGLAPGTYKGVFASSGVVGWIDTAFGGIPCPRGSCDQSTLPPIFATAGGTLSGIDGSLARGRIIRGRITDASTGQGIGFPAFDVDAFIPPSVVFNNSLSNYASFAQIDGRGDYASRTGFPPGATVYPSTATASKRNTATFGLDYVDQNYSGVNCPFSSCGGATGTGITLAGSDVSGIDLALNPGGGIAGTVSASAGGAFIIGATVTAYTTAGRMASRDGTDAFGKYRLRGLPPGSYFVFTSNSQGYLNEVHANVACEPFCNPLIGTPVTVTGTATTPGIDFALDLAATVSGTVNATNVPIEIYGAIGNLLRTTTSGAGGAYAFTGLAAGTYYVRTRNTIGQADELWSGEPCVGDACNVRRGTPVALSAGATANNRNLTLAAPGVISGQVTLLAGGAPQSGVSIQLLAATGAVAMTTTTNGTGNYGFSGLAAGSYYVVTRGTPGLIDVAYPSAPCPAACNGLNGSPIAVTAGTTVSGRDVALQAAGYISGSVKGAGAVPVVGAIVQAYNTGNVPTAQIATNASGNYQIDGLPTGPVYVRTQNTQGLVDQVFKAPVNLQCSGFCDVLSGTQVAVNAGSAIPLPDFNLAGGAIVSGRVTNAATTNGIALATVLAYDRGGNVAGVATANATGNYTIGGLRLLESTGSAAAYRLRTANLSGFVNQLYRGSGNISCSPTPCSNLFLGTAIAVSGTPTAGINFALAAGSVISGTATDQFNNPLPTGTAVLYDSTGAQITTAAIDRGLWQFDGLANGTYYVLIKNNVGLVDQLYANIPCPGGSCSIAALGTPIMLSGGAGASKSTAKGGVATIDLKLNTGQTIAGTVREQGTNAPLAGVTVYFFNAAGVQVGEAVTDGLGEYLSNGSFQANTYYAATANGTTRGAGETILGVGYVNRLYAGQNCLLDCNVAAGTPINVVATPVQNIDFNLTTAGAGITGTVRDAGNQTLEQITVEVYGSDGKLAGTALTNSQGLYAIDGLPAGNYFARTRNNAGLTDALFGGQPCIGACNPLSGTPIAVPAVNAINNIDITLALLDPIFGNGFE